ncbi:hypothetical protein HpMS19_05010 [Helicobacter pylori]
MFGSPLKAIDSCGAIAIIKSKHFDTYIENDKPYDENLATLFKRYYNNERERERVESVKILLFFI